MRSGVARVPGVLLLTACLAACSVTRQTVDLSMRGDVPAGVSRSDSPTYARRITAAFRCPADARRAYQDAVRSRYHQYAAYLTQELSDADYVEIGPVSGGYGGTRRYGSGNIYDGLEETLEEIGDRYAALEWTRFEREWGRSPATTGAGGTPARRPESPPATRPGLRTRSLPRRRRYPRSTRLPPAHDPSRH